MMIIAFALLQWLPILLGFAGIYHYSFLWRQRAAMLHKHSLLCSLKSTAMSISTMATKTTLLPARWGGRRRWQAGKAGPQARIMAWYHAEQKKQQSRQPSCLRTNLQGDSHLCTGMAESTLLEHLGVREPLASHAEAEPRSRVLRGRFPQGRWWMIRIRPSQPWAVCRVQFGAVMKKEPDAFEIVIDGRPVNLAEPVPHDVHEVELRRTALPRGTRSNRSRTPLPHRPRGAQRPEGQDSPRAGSPQPQPPSRDAPRYEEAEILYVDLPTSQGIYRLELELLDIENAEAWPDVTVSDVEISLLRTYPGLFPKGTRLSLAANMRVMRQDEYIQQLRLDRVAFSLVPSMALGTNQATKTNGVVLFPMNTYRFNPGMLGKTQERNLPELEQMDEGSQLHMSRDMQVSTQVAAFCIL